MSEEAIALIACVSATELEDLLCFGVRGLASYDGANDA
jgi:hypothetical protein